MFVIFYTVNLYIFVSMTSFTSFCPYDTLMDPWNVYIYIYDPPFIMLEH